MLTSVPRFEQSSNNPRLVEFRCLNSEYAVEHCFDSIFFTDADKRIICVNPAFERLKGCSKEEVIGDIPAIFKSKKTDPGIYREFWRTLNKGKIWEQEFYGKRKDNSVYYSDMKIIPITDGIGAIKHFMVIEKDISDWKKSQEHLFLTSFHSHRCLSPLFNML